ncbi:MAG: WecB/TagA/CpsF family glycosyltransferase [Clostridiales Family XIII bacterium]|jgi:N-acetylglucosaminyldiphosphoundecaprenol N-acetyl-beta-D-mannosaminyltransferase|nr:WecB/TagA/CpsF family glycosyltransferase [Clostridiales Family XIII bacterium]
MEERNRITILGTPVDCVTLAEAAARFAGIMEAEGGVCAQIATPNSEMLWAASKNEALRRAISEAALVIPDGIGLVHASKIIGRPLSERVAGIDFLGEAARCLAERGASAYFLGGAPGVAARAAEKMVAAYPGLTAAGSRHGYFDPSEEESIVAEINESGAALLCVALGSPKQELFIARHRTSLKAKVAVGVGGSLDVWAGDVKRAPAFFRDNGLEWFYRLVKEPRRIGRMMALPLFMVRVALGGRGRT